MDDLAFTVTTLKSDSFQVTQVENLPHLLDHSTSGCPFFCQKNQAVRVCPPGVSVSDLGQGAAELESLP